MACLSTKCVSCGDEHQICDCNTQRSEYPYSCPVIALEEDEKEECQIIEHPIEIHWRYGGKDVQISGYFNNWKPQKMHRQPRTHHHEYREHKLQHDSLTRDKQQENEDADEQEGVFVFYVGPLQSGAYQYRFWIDQKEWKIDPNKPAVVGEDGNLYNILVVQ